MDSLDLVALGERASSTEIRVAYRNKRRIRYRLQGLSMPVGNITRPEQAHPETITIHLPCARLDVRSLAVHSHQSSYPGLACRGHRAGSAGTVWTISGLV